MYKSRYLEKRLRHAANSHKVLILSGAKGTGKHSILKKIFPDADDVTLLHNTDKYYKRNPESLVMGNELSMVIHNIQFLPELLPIIREKIRDSHQNKQFILTTTQSPDSLQEEIDKFIPDDIAIIKMPHMTIDETENYPEAKNWLQLYLENPSSLPTRKYKVTTTKNLEEILWKGTLPGVAELKSHKQVHNFLLKYIKTVLREDIFALEKIRFPRSFAKFMMATAHLNAKDMNRAYISRNADNVSQEVIRKWLKILDKFQQWYEVPPFKAETSRRISTKSKGVYADTGVACCLHEVKSPEELKTLGLIENMFNAYCINEIMALTKMSPYKVNYSHWLTSSNTKVDLILQIGERIYPIVFQYTKEITRYHASGINSFFKTYADLDLMPAAIIYLGDKCYNVSKDIVAIPWNIVLES